jgi:hypothetical protein
LQAKTDMLVIQHLEIALLMGGRLKCTGPEEARDVDLLLCPMIRARIFCSSNSASRKSKGVQTGMLLAFIQELAHCFACRSFILYSLMLYSRRCLFHSFSAVHRHRSHPLRDHTRYSADHLPVHHGEVEAPYKRMKIHCRSYQVSTPRSSP